MFSTYTLGLATVPPCPDRRGAAASVAGAESHSNRLSRRAAFRDLVRHGVPTESEFFFPGREYLSLDGGGRGSRLARHGPGSIHPGARTSKGGGSRGSFAARRITSPMS